MAIHFRVVRIKENQVGIVSKQIPLGFPRPEITLSGKMEFGGGITSLWREIKHIWIPSDSDNHVRAMMEGFLSKASMWDTEGLA